MGAFFSWVFRGSVVVLSIALVASSLIVANSTDVAAQAGTHLVISEFLAINDSGITDADGDTSDWVEISNVSDGIASLGGWILRDSSSDWAFPSGHTISPGERLIVWASGKDRAVAGSALHASFKLSGSGEYLALVRPGGTIADEYSPAYPPQLADVSYGYGSNGLTGTFNSLTPGSPNGEAIPGRVQPVVASQDRGIYAGPIDVQLSSATPGATIRYTTSGRAVTSNSPVYDGPIPAGPTDSNRNDDDGAVFTIRTVAYAAGHEPSAEQSFTYVFDAEIYEAGLDDLPIMILNNDDGSNAQAATERASVEYIDHKGPGFSVTAGVKEFGESSTWLFNKNSYRLFFDDEWGPKNLRYPIFETVEGASWDPAEKFDKLELRGFSWDGFQGREDIGQAGGEYYVTDRWWKDTVLELGTISPHGRYVNLFLNGDYWGPYHLRERLDAAMYEEYGSEDDDDYEAIKINEGVFYNDNPPLTIVDGTGDVWDHIAKADSWAQVRDRVDARSFVSQALMESLLDGPTEREYRAVGAIDPGSDDDYVIIHNDNDFLFLDPGRNPEWGWGPSGPDNVYLPYLRRWFADPEFQQEVFDHAASAFCDDGPLTPAAMRARLDSIAAQLAPAMAGEQERWANGIVAKWNSELTHARSQIASGATQHRNGWTAQGYLRGCDRRPTLTTPPNLVTARHADTSAPLRIVDPDGDNFTVTATGLPAGLSVTADGVIVGAASVAGRFEVEFTIEDVRGKWGRHTRTIDVVDTTEPAEPVLLVNEYNAVDDGGSWLGSDPAFPGDPQNGGDWFELLTIEDHADLRGVSIELWDRDRDSGRLAQSDTFTFADHEHLADVRAGSLIMIAEDKAEDLSYSPVDGDWTMTANPSGPEQSALLAAGSTFDTTRRGQVFLVRSADGTIAGPIVGETEQWRVAHGNLTASEVMRLCAPPSPDVDPAVDYLDTDSESSFGAPNPCDGQLQDLAALRPTFNSAPTIGDVADKLSTLLEPVEVQLVVSDPEDDRVEVTITDLPPGLALDTTTMVISGRPTSVGSWVTTVSAVDATGESSLTFAWVVQAPEVRAVAECDDGTVEVTVTNNTGSFATYRVTLAGHSPQQRSMSSGLSAIVAFGAVDPGLHQLVVERNGTQVFGEEVEMICEGLPTPTPEPTAVPTPDPAPTPTPGLEVTVATSCLAGNGRVDVNIVNTGTTRADYRVTFGALSPRQATVNAGDWWRQPFTGRSDGTHEIVITRDGVALPTEYSLVTCDAIEPTLTDPIVRTINACRAGLGYILFQIVNPTDQSAGYVIEFEGVRNRSTSAAPFGAAVRAVTGRPDGTYRATIRTGSSVVADLTVLVDCGG